MFTSSVRHQVGVLASIFIVLGALHAPGEAAAQAAPPQPAPSQAPPAESGPERAVPLDPSVQIPAKDDVIPGVFKDMVVVQRKAKTKAGKILFSTFGSLDFSDGPITNYGLNTNLGYALSEFWEVYVNVVPMFITNERPIVKKVKGLQLAGGQQAQITYAKPTLQYGVDLLWLPAYGKESWGPYTIVRSDTFLKLAFAMVNYESGGSGMRAAAMLGKTYFIANWFNWRFAGGLAAVQTIVDNEKTLNWVPVVEAGVVFYF